MPVAVQQTIDKGLNATGGPDIGFVRTAVLLCAVAVRTLAQLPFTYGRW